MKRRQGFTLIELVVVVAVTGTLMTLLLPAVQHAREAARRAQCKNNLKQIGIALHNYENAHTVLPFGNGPRTFPPLGAKPLLWSCNTPGALFMLFPFLDQGVLYNQIDFSVDNCDNGWPPGWSDDWNQRNGIVLENQIVPQVICPSEVWPDHRVRSSYVANFGTIWNYRDRTDGLFHVISSTRFRDVRDGTSNTAAFSEFAGGRTGYQTLSPASFSQSQFEAMCDMPYNLPLTPFESGMPGFYGGSFYMHVKSPNHPECKTWTDPIPHIYGWSEGADELRLLPPSSHHVGLVHMAFLDGAVRPVSDNIDSKIFRALGTIKGGEAIGEF